METQKVDLFLATNAKYFNVYQLTQIKAMLEKADDSKFILIHTIEYKDPTIMLIVSILVGHFGVDRFLMGDIGLGILKLLTCGGAGIWTIVDWFLIMGKAKEANFKNLMMVIA